MLVVSPDKYLTHAAGRYEWTPARAAEAWDAAFLEFRRALKNEARTALLTVGIPGAGKSTFIESLRTKQDLLQHHGHEPHFDGVVFDATLTSRIARRPLIEMARMAGARIEAVVFDVPLVVAMQRNAERAPERRVPYETLVRMLRQLEAEPPTLNEGLWRITSANVWMG